MYVYIYTYFLIYNVPVLSVKSAFCLILPQFIASLLLIKLIIQQ